MALNGIDAVVYGVANMEKCRTHFTDWGLTKISGGKTKSVFETRDGGQIVLRPRASKDLPKAIQPGSTVREIVWGATAKSDLKRIEKELSKDREVTVDRDGTLHSVDDFGLGIAFRLTRRRKLKDTRRPMNSASRAERVNTPALYHEKVQPTHIGHCVFAVPDVLTLLDELGVAVTRTQKEEGVLIEHTIRVYVIGPDGRLLAEFDTYFWDEKEMRHALRYADGK